MKRVATALLLIPLVLAVIFFAPRPVFWSLLVLVALLCLREFFAIAGGLGLHPFSIAGYGGGVVFLFAPDLPQGSFLVGLSALLLVLSLTRGGPLRDTMGGVAATLLGVVYIAGSFALGRDLHAASPHWLVYVLVVNWGGDTAAYYVGRSWGRRPLAPVISPHKTWEGTLASAASAAALGTGYLAYFLPAAVSLPVGALHLAMGKLRLSAGRSGRIGAQAGRAPQG